MRPLVVNVATSLSDKTLIQISAKHVQQDKCLGLARTVYMHRI